ncbi:MAG: hypothetical protein AAB865_01675 [Patescibacteria group bacterium]
MLALTLDLSGVAIYLQRPDILLLKLLYWFGWIPIAAVLVWGFFEVWLFNRQEHYRHKQKYMMLAIDVPRETEQSPKAMEHFFGVLTGLWGGPNFKEKWIDGEVAPVISCELVSDGGYIQYYMRIPTRFRDIIEAGLYAAYPDAEIYEAEDYTLGLPDKFPNEDYNAWGCENKLGKDNYLPIRTYEMFEHKLSQELKDPLGVQLEQYGRLEPGEKMWTQYLIEPLGPAGKTWFKPGIAYIYKEIGKEDKNGHKKSILSDLTSSLGTLPGEVFAELGLWGGGGEHGEEKKEDPWKFLRSTPIDKERLDLVTQKINRPAVHVKIRHVYIAKHAVYKKSARDKMLKSIYEQYRINDGNYFGRAERVQPKHDYFWQKWWEETRRTNVVRAYKKRDVERGGHHFVMNIEELATVWHFPAITLRAPFITKTLAKRAEPPVQLPTELAGAMDFVQEAAEHKSAPVALPVDFTEPTLPTLPRKPAPEPVAPAPAVLDEPAMPAPAPVPTKDSIPDAVRALFDPNIEIK